MVKKIQELEFYGTTYYSPQLGTLWYVSKYLSIANKYPINSHFQFVRTIQRVPLRLL